MAGYRPCPRNHAMSEAISRLPGHLEANHGFARVFNQIKNPNDLFAEKPTENALFS